MTNPIDLVADFIVAACVPLNASHASGTLERAEAILGAHPEVASANIYTAAILGDDATVRQLLTADPGDATAKGGPHDWDALTYLCFSKYLRLDPARSDGFVQAAKTLLTSGASANTGWYEKGEQPKAMLESALYGATGVAHHAGLTRLLLEWGADPNDDEVSYHSPETYDNGALKLLVESGKLTAASLATMLVRKVDWHDGEGIKYLLEHGADPNHMTVWGVTALQHALRRDNDLTKIEALLDQGADPSQKTRDGSASAASIAARRGRRDVLELLEQRTIPMEFQGVERLIAACARNDTVEVRSLVEREPELARELTAEGGTLLSQFAGTGNVEGVRQLLDLGVNVNSPYHEGDGYFGIAKDSTPLHVAAWRAHPHVVKLLIERGAQVEAVDGRGRTPLSLAVRACVDSYWVNRRTPESVQALVQAGASADTAPFPSGYAEVDELLKHHRRAVNDPTR